MTFDIDASTSAVTLAARNGLGNSGVTIGKDQQETAMRGKVVDGDQEKIEVRTDLNLSRAVFGESLVEELLAQQEVQESKHQVKTAAMDDAAALVGLKLEETQEEDEDVLEGEARRLQILSEMEAEIQKEDCILKTKVLAGWRGLVAKRCTMQLVGKASEE